MQRLADALEVSAPTLTRTGISPDELMPALLRDLAQPCSRWSVEEQGARLAEVHAHLCLIYGDECHEATSEPG